MARFLIIDDHPLFREALINAIRSVQPGSDISEAASLSEAVQLLDATELFDLALLDLRIPDTEGYFGLLDLRARYPRLPVAVVSGHEDPRIIRDVVSYGAAGFIPKSVRKQELTRAIQLVLEGEIYLPPNYETPAEEDPDAVERKALLTRLSQLTPQQLRVTHMLRDGLLNKQIAHQMNVGETTVKAHVSEVLRKLGVNTRTQVVIELSKLDGEELMNLEAQFSTSEVKEA